VYKSYQSKDIYTYIYTSILRRCSSIFTLSFFGYVQEAIIHPKHQNGRRKEKEKPEHVMSYAAKAIPFRFRPVGPPSKSRLPMRGVPNPNLMGI
jgi:hypothetical protein